MLKEFYVRAFVHRKTKVTVLRVQTSHLKFFYVTLGNGLPVMPVMVSVMVVAMMMLTISLPAIARIDHPGSIKSRR
jgi:hypothetical protein